ncbi:uncharacterized protein LAESUDRAFT_765600 [Laetiporus sulphureus 93-53]|uniref:Uncharacterized protein n=1 Tax=Laetiporus sulphureus 93-53 TaxID=1314785 RepID=A0A165AP82_9APHY|nr:uncharacterized protein LAESUDRAFT_765600 [Laetiporus sulphureus 93-53]KZS99390.1 hypothetical protein LAESUDRAFT_765600 [Laetiporus sulphureus 93-53]
MPLHGPGDAARDSYMSMPAMPALDYVVPVQPGNPSSPDPDKGGTISAYSAKERNIETRLGPTLAHARDELARAHWQVKGAVMLL